jgi:hypothetical protein
MAMRIFKETLPKARAFYAEGIATEAAAATVH